ncbi:MAG: hypothetical protein NC114_10865 [Ruminococcus flavefaciens]|nr:hypothetical protein [Ruminococcus flavefaciens]
MKELFVRPLCMKCGITFSIESKDSSGQVIAYCEKCDNLLVFHVNHAVCTHCFSPMFMGEVTATSITFYASLNICSNPRCPAYSVEHGKEIFYEDKHLCALADNSFADVNDVLALLTDGNTSYAVYDCLRRVVEVRA